MLHLLVVDGEQNSSRALARFFRGRGFAVDIAEHEEGARALSAIRKYDVVLSALDSDGAGGRESARPGFLTWLRDQTPWARSVLLTPEGDALPADAVDPSVADFVAPRPPAYGTLLAAVIRLAEERR